MKIKLYFFAAIFLLLSLTGCGKDAQLEEYMENMTVFIDQVSDIKQRMEDIDTTSEDAKETLLGCLDELQLQFSALAAMEVPQKFASIETLADEADSYMTEAVTYYHQVFEAAEYDASTADVAQQNYDRAMMRLSYISSLLQGEIPEGENIFVTEEEVLDFEPITDEE